MSRCPKLDELQALFSWEVFILPTQGSKLSFPQSIDLKKCFDSEKQKVFRLRLKVLLLHPKKFMTNFSLHICSSYCAYYHFKAKITERKLNRAEQMDIFFTLSHHYMSFISFDTKAFTTWQRKSLEVAKLLEEQKVVMWLMTLVLNSKEISKNIHSGQKSHYFVFATFFLERVTMWTLFKTMLSSFSNPQINLALTKNG